MLSAELSEKRMKICRECEFYRKYINQCAKCGCVLFAKTRFSQSSCPIGKWDKEE